MYSGEKERLIDGLRKGYCFCDNLLWISLTWRILNSYWWTYRIYSYISRKILYQIIARKVGEQIIHEVALKV